MYRLPLINDFNTGSLVEQSFEQTDDNKVKGQNRFGNDEY